MQKCQFCLKSFPKGGRLCLKLNATTASKSPIPIAAPYAAIPASAMVWLMQD